MVAISLSGSGEGLGRAIARGYSTGNDGKGVISMSFPRKRESIDFVDADSSDLVNRTPMPDNGRETK